MATPAFFNYEIYMTNKLVQMQKAEPTVGWTMTKLMDAFTQNGFAGADGAYTHFTQFGAAEDVAPNASFNANEYYAAKAAQFYGVEAKAVTEFQIASIKQTINANGMNAWTHYQQFGSTEGVNPSNSFDAAAYLAAKATAMGGEWTAATVAKAIADNGMTVLDHYLTYAGKGTGEVAEGSTYPVSDDNRVPSDVTGKTFTLTTGIDVFTATQDNATFNAVADAVAAANTMNSGDVLTAQGGVNTLNVLAQGASVGLVETNGIQNVSVRSVVAGSGFSQLLMNGVESLASNNSLSTLTVAGGDLGTVYSLNNTVNTAAGNATMAVTYANTTGTADEAQLSVNNAGSAAFQQSLTVVGSVAASIEAVTLATAGTNNIALTADAATDEITVTGNGTNTLNVAAAAATNLSFDASATTGTNSLSFAAGLIRTGTSIEGGSGADTLTLTSGAAVNYATPTISGVETIVFNQSAAAATIGLGRTTGLTDINVTTGVTNTGVITLQQLAADVDINIAANASLAAGANSANAITVAGSYTGAADVQNININTTADLVDGVGMLRTTGLETLNYVVTGDADNFAATLAGVTSTNALTTLNVSTEGFTAANEVNVTLTAVTATGSTLTSVDLSGANTGVSLTFGAAALADGAVVQGGSGNDVINAAADVASLVGDSVTINGGVGADTMTAAGGAGSTVFGILEGDSGITATTIDVINGFVTATDSLQLGVAGDNTATTGNFVVGSAVGLTFANALTAANAQFAALSATTLSTQIYSVQTDTTSGNGWLFTDYNLDGTADQAVQINLVGSTVAAADITA